MATESKTEEIAGGNKKHQVRKRMEPILANYLQRFEDMLDNSSSGYIVGDSLTMADISIFRTVRFLNKHTLDHCDTKTMMKKFSKLNEHLKKVLGFKPIGEWYQQEHKGDGEELEEKGYELVYFNIEGRAESIRLAFQCMNVEFRDVRISGKVFQTMKTAGKFPSGQVPVLFVDGEALAQSNAILRYVAKLDSNGNLYPNDAMEAAKVDAVLCQLEDVWRPIVLSMYPKRNGLNFDDDDDDTGGQNTPTLVKGRIIEIMKARLDKYETALNTLTTTFLFGDNPTIADFYLFGLFRFLNQNRIPKTDTAVLLNDKTKIKEYVAMIMKLKPVASWYGAEHSALDTLSGKGLELAYFNIEGLAESIRLSLNHLGVKFTDVRLSKEGFNTLKQENKFPFGQVPVLFVDGSPLAQSTAILRYVAKLDTQNLLYPADAIVAAKVDAFIDDIIDFRSPIGVLFHPDRFGWVMDTEE